VNIEELKYLLSSVEEELTYVLKKKHNLVQRINALESAEFIRVNGITLDSIQRCDDDGMPWMGDIHRFSEWCKENTKKPWCCWNGFIYRTDDIQKGRLPSNSVARYEDVKQ